MASDFKNEQKIFSASDSVYNEIVNLYIANDLAIPSSSGPWSCNELRAMFNKLETVRLFGSMKEVYKEVRKQLYETPDIVLEDSFGFSVGLVLSPEFYTHTNNTDFEEDSDLYYGLEERANLATIPLEFWFANNFYLRSNFSFEIDSTDDDLNNFLSQQVITTNVFTRETSGSANSPYRASVAVGGNHWNLVMGRDVVRWGVGESGNLMVGGNMKYENYARFSTFYNNFKFTMLGVFYPHPEELLDHNDSYNGLKVHLAHRIEFVAFQNKLSVALTESIMYQSSNNTFDLRIYSPANIFHDYYIRSTANSLLGVDINYALDYNWALYGQLVVDEYHIPGEANPNYGNAGSHPDAYGILTGIKKIRSFKEGVFKTVFETVFASPYLYLREAYDDETDEYGVSFYGDYRMYTGVIDYTSYCTGYEYGGDCITGTLKTTYEKDAWKAGIELFYMAHGIIDSAEDYGDGTLDEGESIPWVLATTSPLNSSDPDKTGYIEHTFRVSISGSYQILANVKTYARSDLYLIINEDNDLKDPVNDIQVTYGVKWVI
ncbi:MAG: hypothetical protein BKP49_00410 [Treponema sp. CETP13]|nr:MAG: hypothetical protein BKP49_00410 [Treponema sp. CETP13]